MKIKSALIFLLLVQLGSVNAQNTYTALTEKAINIVKSKDSTQFAHALSLFEKAFKISPDSINKTGLYHASILASNQKETEKAFKYLIPLAKMEIDEEGYPGWEYILNDDAEIDFKNIAKDPRWEALKTAAGNNKEEFFNRLKEREKEFYLASHEDLKPTGSPKKLYQNIRSYNPYQQKKHRDYSLSLEINDSTKTSFHVHLPKAYSPKKKYPVLFFLHGGVRFSSLQAYQNIEYNLGGWNRYYTKYGNENEVILVFPSAGKEYNWMLHDKGFFMIPKIVRDLKTTINVDDNKVFIAGHSNGATGTFSYLMKQAGQFAGFYGFNTQPKVYTGGTFIENVLNRSFINYSTDQDYYYPPGAYKKFSQLMDSINADYKDYRYKGFPHWFPKFDESEPAYQILFNDLKSRQRNPFPKYITWEFDDDKYGNIDWLSHMKLDTLQDKSAWQKELNFKIDKWLVYDKCDSLIEKTVDRNAFDFPRKSGRIIAEYEDNTFKVKTSRIGSFRICISPEMVNLKENVKVYINGKLCFSKKLKYNHDFLLKNFIKNKDREQVWVNYIELEI